MQYICCYIRGMLLCSCRPYRLCAPLLFPAFSPWGRWRSFYLLPEEMPRFHPDLSLPEKYLYLHSRTAVPLPEYIFECPPAFLSSVLFRRLSLQQTESESVFLFYHLESLHLQQCRHKYIWRFPRWNHILCRQWNVWSDNQWFSESASQNHVESPDHWHDWLPCSLQSVSTGHWLQSAHCNSSDIRLSWYASFLPVDRLSAFGFLRIPWVRLSNAGKVLCGLWGSSFFQKSLRTLLFLLPHPYELFPSCIPPAFHGFDCIFSPEFLYCTFSYSRSPHESLYRQLPMLPPCHKVREMRRIEWVQRRHCVSPPDYFFWNRQWFGNQVLIRAGGRKVQYFLRIPASVYGLNVLRKNTHR